MSNAKVRTYSEENKYLNTLLFCKFSHLEIMEGSEIVIVGACPLWEKKLKKKNPEITMYDFLTIYLYDTAANKYLNTCLSARILTLKDLLVCL